MARFDKHNARIPTLASCLASLAAISIAACGGSPAPASPSASTSPTVTAATSVDAPKAPRAQATSLSRSGVKTAIAKGVGALLQNVTFEDWPAMKDGKFYGFRIKAINPELGIDMRPGDVLLRVNGMPIEHPEDADAALRSLEKAPKLRVDYERDGKPLVLELPIVDDTTKR